MTQENIKQPPANTIDSMRRATMVPRRKKNGSGLSKRPLAIGDNGADKKLGSILIGMMKCHTPIELPSPAQGRVGVSEGIENKQMQIFNGDRIRPSGFVLRRKFFYTIAYPKAD